MLPHGLDLGSATGASVACRTRHPPTARPSGSPVWSHAIQQRQTRPLRPASFLLVERVIRVWLGGRRRQGEQSDGTSPRWSDPPQGTRGHRSSDRPVFVLGTSRRPKGDLSKSAGAAGFGTPSRVSGAGCRKTPPEKPIDAVAVAMAISATNLGATGVVGCVESGSIRGQQGGVTHTRGGRFRIRDRLHLLTWRLPARIAVPTLPGLRACGPPETPNRGTAALRFRSGRPFCRPGRDR